MRETLPHLQPTSFPSLQRKRVSTLQINIGLKCNLACLHCHVNSNPYRKEKMSDETIELVKDVLRHTAIKTLDITGGAPEMHPRFRELISAVTEQGVQVIDRCNLTILLQPGYESLAGFLADNKVEIIASLPCYSEENVDQQRGKGVFTESITALQLLNTLGYGKSEQLRLHLVYNPVGPFLPPDQIQLQEQYKSELGEKFGIEFNQLLTLANMPIKRFGSTLLSKGTFQSYMQLLKQSHNEENLEDVMCRDLISVDWEGYLYDCDFNQMLGLSMASGNQQRLHLRDLLADDLAGNEITVAEHCYGCTAGQGSSCGGALQSTLATR